MYRRHFLQLLSALPPAYLFPQGLCPERVADSALTGFKSLDNLTGGFIPGSINIIAGRPSMGKTAVAIALVDFMLVQQKGTVAVFSLESSRDHYLKRLLAHRTAVPLRDLTRGQLNETELKRVTRSTQEITDASLFVDDRPGITPSEIRSKTLQLHKTTPLDLVVIDYFQLLQTAGETKLDAIESTWRKLHAIAKETSAAFVVLFQLDRYTELRGDRHPRLDDLRRTLFNTALPQTTADTVMFLYRDSYYDLNVDNSKAEIIVARSTSGVAGVVNIHWDFKTERLS